MNTVATSQKTIGVILAGAGYLDGAEIQEAVCALLALDEAGAEVRIFAPDMNLVEVDHLTQEPTGKERNVLHEAARIARSNVADLSSVTGTDVDGWVIPGGFGAAKNLCDFAVKGSSASAHREVARVLREAWAAHLPVGACCIAPAVLATVARGSGKQLTITIGNDEGTAKAINAMGAKHVNCPVDDCVVDAEHKVCTAPAYMYDAKIADVAKGIRKMVQQIVEWA